MTNSLKTLIVTLVADFSMAANIQAHMPTVVAIFQIAAYSTTIASNISNILKNNKSDDDKSQDSR